jgi:hypothetical protein
MQDNICSGSEDDPWVICELRRNLRESIEPIDQDAVGGTRRKPKGIWQRGVASCAGG